MCSFQKGRGIPDTLTQLVCQLPAVREILGKCVILPDPFLCLLFRILSGLEIQDPLCFHSFHLLCMV